MPGIGLSPTAIFEETLVGLATYDFSGINGSEFWDFVASHNSQSDGKPLLLDQFTKTVIWSWLLENKDFQVWKIDDSEAENNNKTKSKVKKTKSNGKDDDKSYNLVSVDKSALPPFDDFFDNSFCSSYILKMSEDYQSLYLASCSFKNNILGKKPYELIRIIAKYKEKGINSIDLIKESGQDSRSLTTRLNLLEKNMLITKVAVCVQKSNSNHMTHFRFSKKNSLNPDSGEPHIPNENYYDQYAAMAYVGAALEAAENKIRLTKDLYVEVKKTQPIMKVRAFNRIIRILVKIGLVELIQVEHKEMKRFFAAVRLVETFPDVNKLPTLMESLKDSGFGSKKDDADITNGLEGNEEEEEETNNCKFNRFLPLTNQIYDMIKLNPGMAIANLDDELTGSYHVKQIASILENISITKPDPSDPDAIVAQIFHSGKMKYNRFTTQDYLNKNDPSYKPIGSIEEIETVEASPRSLFEEHMLYGSSSTDRRKVRYASLYDNRTQSNRVFMVPKGYSGKCGTSAIESVPITPFFRGTYKSSNEWISLNVSKGKLTAVKKDLAAYKSFHDAKIENINKFNEEIITSRSNEEVFNDNIDVGSDETDTNFFLQFQSNNITNEQPLDNTEKDKKFDSNFDNGIIENTTISSEPPSSRRGKFDFSTLDYGPEFRRKKLSEVIDEDKCVCLNTTFCDRLSKILKLEYTIARRTMVNDAEALESKNLIEIERVEGGRIVAKSVKNPPTEEEVSKCLVGDYKVKFRKFTSTVQLDNITINNKDSLTRGWKFPNKEARLQHAINKLKESTENAGKRKRTSRKARILGIDEKDDENGVDGEGSDNDSEFNKTNPLDDDNADDDGDVEMDEGEGDETHDDDTTDVFEPLMDDRKRKKHKISSKSYSRVAKAFKKIRVSIQITNEHILLLIKAAIITQSLALSGNIFWPKVSLVLEDQYSADLLKRQWPKYKKMLGSRNLLVAKKNWENVLIDAVKNRLVSSEELINYDIFKMLDLWKSVGADIFLNNSQNDAAKTYEENFQGRVFKPLKKETGFDVYRETISMIEKEELWTNRNFMYSNDEDTEQAKVIKECDEPTSLQIAKTKLKAFFATNKEKFDAKCVRDLFEDIPKELYAEALTDLEDQKAIAFLGEGSKIKFTLTDKLFLALDCKLNEEFISSSNKIIELLDDVSSEDSNGLLLSPKCPSGSYAPLFELFISGDIKVTRIDRKLDTLNTYYTKSIDRSKFESDFLISNFHKENNEDIIAKKVTPPIDSPCSYLWIDLRGDFNSKLWNKCLFVILWSIVSNPGTPLDILCSRMYPLLEPFEVKKIVDWLLERGNVVMGQVGGFWPTRCWFDV